MPHRAIAFINPAVSTENVGDLFILDSIRRILDIDASRSVDIDPRKPITDREIDLMNAADAVVIAGTNLWYRTINRPGKWTFTANDLRRIKRPIIPLGVGTTRHVGEDNGFDADTLDQLRIIHASCNRGSARDQRTYEALTEAGLSNVRMTGCPTLFRSLKPEWMLRDKRQKTKKIVVTVRKGQRDNVRELIRQLKERGYEPVVAAQQDKDLFLKPALPLLKPPAPILYEYDIRPYMALVEEAIGAVGWRLHGNMIHLAHGNPAILVSNCSRGESFCECFGLPKIRVEDGTPMSNAEIGRLIDLLLDPRTFEHLPRQYATHRAAMAAFLDENDLAHNLR